MLMLEAAHNNKKWITGILLIILLALVSGFLTTTLVFHEHDMEEVKQQHHDHGQQQQQPPADLINNINMIPTRDLKDSTEQRNQLIRYISIASQWVKNIILGFLGGGGGGIWPSNNEIGTNGQSHEPNPDLTVISPNLSTCHQSYGATGFLVHCCPPKPESEEPIIDFQLPNPSSTLRVRRPVHLIDDEYIAKYNKALSIMKSLPFDDPRSFMRQADMHCIYCTGAYNQKHSKSLLNIHKSWLFFPWHRMMIYFHEKILGDLIGDETFALPFWNWDAPEGMILPKMYMEEPFLDKERDRSHLRPRVADINYNMVESTLNNDDQISRNLAFMYNQMVSGAKKTELFMGCPLKVGEAGACVGRGTIESAPHNTLHSWVGSNLNPRRENMGVFYAAARDPIFYGHHSNIDRLWEVWKELRGYKPEIVDPDWLDSYFFFHNEKSQLVRIKIRDVLNITNLGYSYQKVDLPWLNARPKPSVPPKIARNKLMMSMKNTTTTTNTTTTPNNHSQLARDNIMNWELHSCFEPEGRTLDTNIRVKVNRPKKIRTKKEKEEEEEVLVVYGINVKEDMNVKFDVYVNLVLDDDDDKLGTNDINIGPESREFAGTFVNMRRGVTMIKNEGDEVIGNTNNNRKSNLKLGISELLEDLEADEDDSIWVTLVPRGGTGINTTVDGVRIEYME